MNLLLLREEEVDRSGRATLTGPRAAHLIGVLKVAPGKQLRAGLLEGQTGSAEVERVSDGEVRLACRFDGELPARPAVDLLLALPRPKVLKRLWATLASLGIGHLYLSNAWRVERNYFDTHLLRPEVYNPLLIEGLQQAGDTRLPNVSVHKRITRLLQDNLCDSPAERARVVAHPRATSGIGAILESSSATRVLLAIGPEGGWIDRELDLFRRHGFLPVTLGPRVLRSDTACVALLTLAHQLLGGVGRS